MPLIHPDEKFIEIGHRFEFSPENMGFTALAKRVLQNKMEMISRIYHEGYSESAFDLLVKELQAAGARKIYESSISSNEEHLFLMDDGVVEITTNKLKHISLNLATTNTTLATACKEIITKNFTGPSKKGYVFAIMRNAKGSLDLTKIGYAGIPLEKGNYTPELIKDYEYIVDDLKSPDPSGRIVILDGTPGTGKTFLVRSLLMEVQDAMFVIVPPGMVSSIGGPDLLPLLCKTRESYNKKGPTILVLEDAEQCLAPRQFDNISSISSILNLGDGIFGSLFDVRIIATTNAKAKDIDPAIVREGRLSKRVNVGTLTYEEANVIFRRLVKDDMKDMPHQEYERNPMKPTKVEEITLARVYKMARNAGWRPEPQVKMEGPLLLDQDESKPYEDYIDDADY
jgi:hypothetical protein